MKAFMPQLIFYEQQRLIVRFRLEIKDKLEISSCKCGSAVFYVSS
ncbi:hypothetical protein [Bacillus canaveralius]|nr:hypothetical protein [Bacillus canaveralius]